MITLLTAYDCFDLHDFLVYFRNSPYDPQNIETINHIISVLKQLQKKTHMSTHGGLRDSLILSNNSKPPLGFHDKYYSGNYLCLDKKVIDSIIIIFEKMVWFAQKNDYLSFVKIAELVHEIPIEMIDNKRKEKHLIKISKVVSKE